jgi:hypothetical protein
MNTVKVTEWVDIDAPRSDLFKMILNLERRFQLSPLYGTTQVDGVSDDYPNEGSSYRLRLKEPADYCYDSIVTDFQPDRKFAYSLCIRRNTKVCWFFQETPRGTRVIYEEEFTADEATEEDFISSVRKAVKQWLKNIKLYAELHRTRFGRFMKWVMDRYFLRLRSDQRNIILAVLFMQLVGFISFVMAAIAMGIAGFIS